VIEPPIAIRLATKESKTTAKDDVTKNVKIATGLIVKVKFLIILLESYAVSRGCTGHKLWVAILGNGNNVHVLHFKGFATNSDEMSC
jgi:hypothetical protein